MILVDTSIWVDHLRTGRAALAELLNKGLVMIHPFVIGELALGHLRQRETVLAALSDLPHIDVATAAEAMHFIGRHVLFGHGIGYVDAHLLASVLLTPGSQLWTGDRRLHAVASQLKLAAVIPQASAP